MKINIFKCARRIAILCAVLLSAVMLINLIGSKPFGSAIYSIGHPNGEFVYVETSCPTTGYGWHSFVTKTSNKKRVLISLCLLPTSFEEREKKLYPYIPYKVDEKGKVLSASAYSPEVSDYKKRLEKRFKIPFKDEDKIKKKQSRRYKEDIVDKLSAFVVGLAILFGIVFAIGWIMRGLLGIPYGTDKRPDA